MSSERFYNQCGRCNGLHHGKLWGYDPDSGEWDSKVLHQVAIQFLVAGDGLNQKIKCTSYENGKTCIGFFGYAWSKLSFYSVPIMALTISLMANIRNIIQIIKLVPVHSRKKYYCIAVFNNSISEFLISLYLCSLLVADATKVNVLFWTLSPICLILKLISYVSFQTMVIFKTHALFCMSLQIIYPFKHQNGYLKWTVPMCLVLWVIVSSSSFSTIFNELQQDELCSIAKCSENNTLNLLLFMVCVINCGNIILYTNCDKGKQSSQGK